MPNSKRRPAKHPGGRPRTREHPSVLVTTRLDAPVVERLEEWAKERELTRSAAVSECVRRTIGGR